MAKVQNEAAGRKEIIKRQMEEDTLHQEEELRRQHEARREKVLVKHNVKPEETIGTPPVIPTTTRFLRDEDFREQHRQLLLQQEDSRLNALSKRLLQQPPPPPVLPLPFISSQSLTVQDASQLPENPAPQPVEAPAAAVPPKRSPPFTSVPEVVPPLKPDVMPVFKPVPTVTPQAIPVAQRMVYNPNRLVLHMPTHQEVLSRTQTWNFGSDSPDQPRRGIVNLGNTCYLNSVTQCLVQTLLCRYFLSDDYIHFIVKRFEGGGRIANTFSYIAREMNANVTFAVSPSCFKNAIAQIYDSFANSSQQDANEFLRAALDGIHENLNECSGVKVPAVEIDTSKGSDDDIAKQFWAEYTKRNRSIVVTLFGFQERSMIECPSCKRCSRSFNAAMSIEVPIPFFNRTVTIEDCLSKYCAEEVLDESSMFQCGGCQKKVCATKQLSLYSLPEVLVISLKRFRSNANFSDKVTNPVAFQPILDVSPYISNPKQTAGSTYRLVGIVNHQGNIHGGHYTADTRGIRDGCWFSFSDEVVRVATAPDFKLAYMLFYARIQPQLV